MKYISFIPVFLSISLLGGCNLTSASHSIELKDIEADGSPPRIEREFKYSLQGEGLNDFDSEALASEIHSALTNAVEKNDLWRATEFADRNYYTDDESLSYAYFDVYFDTEDHLNYQHSVSYRLRERFKSMAQYEKYVQDQEDGDNWPYRIEFQAKVGREELGAGFSSVQESRFEFREESDPFSKSNPPPSRPWDLDEFIGYLRAGRFKNYYTWPAKAVVDFLIPDFTDETELVFEPVLVLVTERQRQHLNIKTTWGSGPNPEQAYIISLDRSDVYDGPEYLDYLRGAKIGKKMTPPQKKARFVEIEVEFERNVSGELDEAIQKAEEAGDNEKLNHLSSARAAFFADQSIIMSVIKEYFGGKGIQVVPANNSKYLQSF